MRFEGSDSGEKGTTKSSCDSSTPEWNSMPGSDVQGLGVNHQTLQSLNGILFNPERSNI